MESHRTSRPERDPQPDPADQDDQPGNQGGACHREHQRHPQPDARGPLAAVGKGDDHREVDPQRRERVDRRVVHAAGGELRRGRYPPPRVAGRPASQRPCRMADYFTSDSGSVSTPDCRSSSSWASHCSCVAWSTAAGAGGGGIGARQQTWLQPPPPVQHSPSAPRRPPGTLARAGCPARTRG